MKPRKLRVYDACREWSRIRVRMATKPDSIRVENSTQKAETFFEPVIDLKQKTISGNTMSLGNPFEDGIAGLTSGYFGLYNQK